MVAPPVPWAPVTAYGDGAVVDVRGVPWLCVADGTSGASLQHSMIHMYLGLELRVDGTCIWLPLDDANVAHAMKLGPKIPAPMRPPRDDGRCTKEGCPMLPGGLIQHRAGCRRL